MDQKPRCRLGREGADGFNERVVAQLFTKSAPNEVDGVALSNVCESKSDTEKRVASSASLSFLEESGVVRNRGERSLRELADVATVVVQAKEGFRTLRIAARDRKL